MKGMCGHYDGIGHDAFEIMNVSPLDGVNHEKTIGAWQSHDNASPLASTLVRRAAGTLDRECHSSSFGKGLDTEQMSTLPFEISMEMMVTYLVHPSVSHGGTFYNW